MDRKQDVYVGINSYEIKENIGEYKGKITIEFELVSNDLTAQKYQDFLLLINSFIKENYN